MINFFKKLFGRKEKKTEKEPLPAHPIPIEEKNIMDIAQPEEPIAPTLERQDEIIVSDKPIYDSEKSNVTNEERKEPVFNISPTANKIIDDTLKPIFEKSKKKTTKSKKQAKKKDNRNPDDDKKSWPKGNNFSL